jgi:DNA uptake protein ComE-like DNA-binding protein
VYAALLVAYLVLDTPAHHSNASSGVAAALALLAWIGGGAHAFAVRDEGRRLLAT